MRKPQRILSATCLIFLTIVSSNNLLMTTNHSGQSQQSDNQSSTNQNLPKTQSGPSTQGENHLQPSGVDRELLAHLAQQAPGANGNYQLIWEPNRVQGSVHAVAVFGTIVAIGAGFLYDNEIHIYHWNPSMSGQGGLTHAFDIGSGTLHSDVLSLAFGDTDRDGFVEIVAGTADGGIYVFEQENRTLTDPHYYQFQPVWNTNVGMRVTSVAVDDLDNDGRTDIVAGSWTSKVYVYEYKARVGTPGTPDHLQYYDHVWDSGNTITGLVNSIATGDTDADGFREIIAGASDHKVYIFENGNATIPSPIFPHADNAYVQVWNSEGQIPGPVQTVTVSNSLDQDIYGEIAVTSPGHGVYVFDYEPSNGDYSLSKLVRPVESWEQDPPFPIDHYVDQKTSGNATTGVVEPWERVGASCSAPYVQDTTYCLPGINPTAIAGPPDLKFPNGITLLNATRAANGLSTIVLDFGKDEELTGGGDGRPDLTVQGLEVGSQDATLDNLGIYLSRDGANFTLVKEGLKISKVGSSSRLFNVTVDVDPTLAQLGWEWFRYVKVTTTAQFYLDAIVGSTLYRPITDAVSTSVSFDRTLGRVLMVGTTSGTLKAFASNGTAYNQVWDSYRPIPPCQPGTSFQAGNCQSRTRFSMKNNIWSIAPAFSGHNFFVLGTNPKITFVEIDPATLETKTDWDTSNVLDKWSMSVTLADTDGDGQKEVVVGSFDNNLYVFHHVFLNTYRRAWQSPDLVHNQTIWDHVSQVLVGDYDGDGKLELLAANDNQTYPIVYVFRSDPTAGQSQFSLSETENLYLAKNSGPITAMEFGNDLNQDRAKEVLVAAGRNITMFERINSNTVKSTLPVIPSTYVGQILALATGDPDGDGRGDIIAGGWVSIPSTLLPLARSFLIDWEYDPSSRGFSPVWSPSPAHLSRIFSSMSIAIGDQDKNGKNEIIVGHDFGINIYENTGDNAYATKQIITSSAVYPYYSPNQLVSLANNYVPGPTNGYEGWTTSSAPVVQMTNKTYVSIYTSLDPTIDHTQFYWNESRIFYKTSQDGVTWSNGKRLTSDNQYTADSQCGNGILYYERNPSAVAVGNSVWVAYEAKLLAGLEFPAPSPYLCVYATRVGTGHPNLDLSRIASHAISPSIFLNNTITTFPGTTPGITYLNYTTPGTGANMLFLAKSQWTSVSLCNPPCFNLYFYLQWETTPELQNSKIGSGFKAFSQSAAFVAGGTLAIVFDGYNATSGRNIPNIWYTSLTRGQAGPGSWSKPRWLSALTYNQTLSSSVTPSAIGIVLGPFREELAPSISTLNGNVLALVYQEADFLFGITQSSLYITVSADNGTSWTDPQLLPTGLGIPYAPAVAGLVDGGYMLTYHNSLGGVPPSSPKIFTAFNPLDGWWRYSIGPVQALVLGDTDGNGFNEIIAGSLKRVYVLELTDTGTGNLVYQEKWVSQQLANKITGIAIGDINGDNTPEIVATAMSGNLYAFEWVTA